ncbi:MAG: peroxiredoxin [Candidatus Marinimicrobia bacterium]|jgi:peroxiredoxin (alkyl hydroperoxide reductase subunit C)|nr:peroxiredoxin [Candidatus Neomarinimicrobiota bacterium]MBT3617909.1 peroxiredoxin [Candidatus Neomarinimicrobiota bacterium]MBT3828746.1 peroxiredoxin [Candidatus Neomarinimicrobiota bacterium]MBT3997037.1 peroxiredoxin [Candidatus Neomarinimicrobiota bacterium]MBT4280793.1 peroxiredoxin [Candidatus Neomarinimicrobiota bacterium]
MLVTKTAPDFKATAIMPDNSFQDISLADYEGKKVVLFFYPLDFTFVCPTEIIAFDHRLAEFEKRGVQVLGCSIDSHFSHWAWKNTDVNKGGIGNVQYPIIADLDKSIARAYDVLIDAEPATVLTDEEEYDSSVGGNIALRGSFLIDEKGVVRHAVINDLPLGRNIDEMLRMVDALDFHTEHGEVCPAGWTEGEDGMKDTAEGVAGYLTENADEL